MKRIYLTICLVLVATSLFPTLTAWRVKASPETKTIHITYDNTILEDFPDKNFDTEPPPNNQRLFVGKYSGNRRRTLLYFDLSDIPPGSTIISAKLKLYFRAYQTGFTGAFIRVHRLTTSWSETKSTWNIASMIYNPILGIWIPLPWSNPGGDYDPTTLASLHISPADVNSWLEIELKNIVQDFVNKVYPNYGIILEADTSSKYAYFDSSDGSNGPQLVIEYTPAKIELTPSPKSQTVVQGGSTSYQIVVGGTYKGNANVNIDWIAPGPSGVTVTPDVPSGVVPFVLTVTVQTSAATDPGDYKLRVELQGTEGSPAPSNAVILELHVEPPVTPDFSLVVIPGSQKVNQGGSVEFTVDLTASGGFSKPVTLSVSGLPPGASHSFSLNNQVPDFSSILSISVSPTTPLGTYTITVTGSGGGKTHDYPVTLEVIEATGFNVKVEPSSQTAQQGESVDYTVHVVGTGGFSKPVTLAITGLPPGAAISATANSLPPDYDSTITIQLAADTPTKTYTMYIIATGGGLSVKSNAFILTVTPAGPSPTPTATPTPTPTPAPTKFDFEVSVTPKSLTLPASGSGSVVVQLTLTSGTSQLVTLSASGLPSDARYNFSPDTLKPTGSSTFYITAGTTPGTFTILIRASGGGVEKTTTLTLVIEAPKKCVIATATYGSELSSEVQFLREFRDNFVMKTFAGQQFMRAFNAFYYSWSPPVADIIANHKSLKEIFKFALYPLIGTLKIASKASLESMQAHPEVAVTLAGIISSLLLGLIYLTPILLSLVILLERRGYSLSSVLVIKWLIAALLASLLVLGLGEVLLLPILALIGSSALVLSALPLLSLPISISIGRRLS